MNAQRLWRTAAPLFVGLIGILAAACAPPVEAPTGISFYPPTIGYVGKQYVPTATAANQLPVSFSLGASSSGCALVSGVLYFQAPGDCVVLADQPGDAENPPHDQVQRTIKIYECPTLRPGLWTGPSGTSANLIVNGSTFFGTADLSAFGLGAQPFLGTIDCDLLQMDIEGTQLAGRLAFDGSYISGSFSGIGITLYAPPA